jgi:hypothetical protein
MTISEINLNTVNSVGFIFSFSLKDELLEDSVGTSNDRDGEHFDVGTICLLGTLDAEVVSAVEDGVGSVIGRSEHDFDALFTGNEIIAILTALILVIFRVHVLIFLGSSTFKSGPDGDVARRGLEFTRTTPSGLLL